MRKIYVFCVAVTVILFGLSFFSFARAQGRSDDTAATSAKTIVTSENVVERLDPGLDEIISSDAKLVSLNDGFGFTEGLNWVQNGDVGYLLFSDIPMNTVYKMTADGKSSVYLDRSGYTGPFNGFTLLTTGGSHSGVAVGGPHKGQGFVQLGSDGLTVDLQGRLIICAFGDRALERLEKDGTRTILYDGYQGKRSNGPNDVVVKKDGTIYFSETIDGLRDGPAGPKSLNKGMDFSAILMIKDNKLSPVITDILNPNGLAFSPDEKYLYANYQGTIRRYTVQPDDTMTDGQLLIDMKIGANGPGGPDGMRVNSRGDIFSSGAGGVWIISPGGKHLGTIRTPLSGANMSFGDPDWKTLYFGAASTIYKIRVLAPGLPCNSCTSK